MSRSLTYADAGVDIQKADKFVSAIKKIANSTRRIGVMGEIGGFGGLVVYYMREISRSIKDMTFTLIKHEERFVHHDVRITALEEGCPLLRDKCTK